MRMVGVVVLVAVEGEKVGSKKFLLTANLNNVTYSKSFTEIRLA